MNTTTEKTYLSAFKMDVCDRCKEVDTSEEQDWYSLSVGYFLGKGSTIEDAYKLANRARYTYHYWMTT